MSHVKSGIASHAALGQASLRHRQKNGESGRLLSITSQRATAYSVDGGKQWSSVAGEGDETTEERCHEWNLINQLKGLRVLRRRRRRDDVWMEEELNARWPRSYGRLFGVRFLICEDKRRWRETTACYTTWHDLSLHRRTTPHFTPVCPSVRVYEQLIISSQNMIIEKIWNTRYNTLCGKK